MSEQLAIDDIPPCPQALLDKLKEPVCTTETCAAGVVPGSVQEVLLPDGGIVRMLLTKVFTDAPFGFARAIPLSDILRSGEDDDISIYIEPQSELVEAHCWLEGPVLLSAIFRCIGTVSDADMKNVFTVAGGSCSCSSSSAYRKSLYEEFAPLYSACWSSLYADLAEV